MPASTFPTKSAPTSAPFVKIPPPSLAKIEINDAPKPRATNAFTISLSSTLNLIINNSKQQLITKLNQQLTFQLQHQI